MVTVIKGRLIIHHKKDETQSSCGKIIHSNGLQKDSID